jgi:hypothetical protein
MAIYVYDKNGKIIAGLNSNSANFDKYKSEYESSGYKVDSATSTSKPASKTQPTTGYVKETKATPTINYSNSSDYPTSGSVWVTRPDGSQTATSARDLQKLLAKGYSYVGVRTNDTGLYSSDGDLIQSKSGSSNKNSSYGSNIDNVYDQQRKSLIAQLKASIAKAKGGYTDMINKAPQTFQPLRNQTELTKEQQLRSALERNAATGDRGGIGRQGLLGINTAAGNQMNQIDLQQQNVINDANSAISSLDEQAAFEESSITADMASQKLQALLGEQTRIDELNRDQTEKAEELKTKMSEDDRQRFIDTIGRYSNDFTAQRNQIRDDGDPSNDWQIPYLEREAQNKRAEAQAKYQRQGYVSEDIAAALGLKVGTMTDAYKMSLQTANQKQLVDNALKLFDDIGYITPQMAQILSAYGLPSDAVSLVKLKQQNTGGSGGGGGGSSSGGSNGVEIPWYLQ